MNIAKFTRSRIQGLVYLTVEDCPEKLQIIADDGISFSHSDNKLRIKKV